MTVGTLINLPATPNSMIFNQAGTLAYLGTDSSQFGTRGVMVLSPGGKTVSEFPAAAGKVLAVSAATTSSTSSSCANNTVVALNIAGATAAAFSLDGLKAYIISGNTLYVYSKLDALKTIPLAA